MQIYHFRFLFFFVPQHTRYGEMWAQIKGHEDFLKSISVYLINLFPDIRDIDLKESKSTILINYCTLLLTNVLEAGTEIIRQIDIFFKSTSRTFIRGIIGLEGICSMTWEIKEITETGPFFFPLNKFLFKFFSYSNSSARVFDNVFFFFLNKIQGGICRVFLLF